MHTMVFLIKRQSVSEIKLDILLDKYDEISNN